MDTLVCRQDETLIMEGVANKLQIFGSKGGKLYLTNQRLVFIAHALNIGSKFDEVALSEIATNGNSFKFHTTTNLISFNINLETRDGKKLGFVVTRSQKDLWIQKIGEAIYAYVAEHITMPDVPAEIEPIVKHEAPIEPHEPGAVPAQPPQIKVVACGGCGAFVVVMGGLARCEYCGRPTVG